MYGLFLGVICIRVVDFCMLIHMWFILTWNFSHNLHTETQHSAPSGSRGRSPIPTLNVTSTPHEERHPPHELFLTPAGLLDTRLTDKNDSLSSPYNSRDEADVDYLVQADQINKDKQHSHTSSSSSLKQETVV